MSRILYGLCSVGLGHAIRSRTILEHLSKKHELFIVASGDSFAYLSNYFKNIHEIEGLQLAFRSNKTLTIKTILKNLKKINPRTASRLKNVYKKIEEFNPDLVISDWEPFTSYTAKKLKLKLLSVDNQHYIMHGIYAYPKTQYLQKLKAQFILKALTRKADKYIIMALPKQKLKYNKNIIKTRPVIRKTILSAKPKKRNYILVYQSTKTYSKLLSMLKTIPENFIIYGYNISKRDNNLVFRSFNDKRRFFNDLINCKAIITNGGFTLISEAIHMKKPILAIPIKKHFEQYMNSLYIKKNNLGDFRKNLTKHNLRDFISRLESYKTISTNQKNNYDFYQTLDKSIEELKK